MSVFDLKPLSTATIDDLKIKSHQLWEIKIDENIYGPFETLQLRHYSKENKEVLSRALVSPMSIDSWRPFFEVREFIHEAHYSGPYWILNHGQKSSPLPKPEIAKRIELGTIGRNDEISEDDGRQWHRISTHPEFEEFFTTGSSLPKLPQESSFQKAKLQVLEQLETRASWTNEKENLASLTHVSLARKEKTRTINVENIHLAKEAAQNPSFWSQHKIHAVVGIPVVLMGFYFIFSPKAPRPEVVAEIDGPEKETRKNPVIKRSKKDSWTRTPATTSSESSYQRSAITQPASYDDNYPTMIETHQEPDNYPDPRAEADQVAEIQDQENRNEEHSLVDPPQPNRDPAQEGDSLDATMNNEGLIPDPAIDPPVVEEVSDF